MKTMKKIITLSFAVLLLAALDTNISFAGKPSSKGGKVTVDSANPNSVVQTFGEDVTIVGTGFDDGSTVRFLVTGSTDDSQIEVGPAQFISSTELKVHIKTTGSTATVDYDVEVQATSGRKGKGTTLFKVNNKGGDPCANNPSKDPAIVYLTVTEQLERKGAYTRDIKLVSASGCDSYMLLDDAAEWLPDIKQNRNVNRFIRSVSHLRVSIRGDIGVAMWVDTYIRPWPLMVLWFEFDSTGNLTVAPAGPQRFDSPLGYDITHGEPLITTSGELIVAMIERFAPPDPPADWLTSVVNLTNGIHEIITSGNCQVQDDLGDCYIPDWGDIV